MNKNIKQVLVRVEYHNQVWFEAMNIEIYYGKAQSESARPDYRASPIRGGSESDSKFFRRSLSDGN